MRKMKKGVSLVTVLLFMMVATIAATATYKWLSSVGMSSAARMQLNEARQSALSGIEAARSWMTYNGNDLGAVIKQYFEEGKKPILLNSVLPRVGSGKMRDSVWLMGVNIESSSRYKVKIVSLGTTRENVKYSEVAIFNVGGLYQAEIPSEVHNVAYKDAFHGSLTTAGAINVTSAFIKQSPAIKNAKGQALNSISASEYLVLDGNFYVNNGGTIKDLYVTGDLSFLKNLNVSRNLYVGGKVYGTSTASQMNVYGSSYLNGGMKVNDRSDDVKNNGLYSPSEVTGGKFNFYGNVTSNGDIDHFKAEASASYIEMHKNLVLNGKLNFPTSASSNDYYFHVDSNAFIKENSTTTGNIGTNYIGKTLFGNDIDDTLYLAQFEPHNGANDCGSLYNCAKSTNGNIYVAYKGRLVSMLLPEQYRDWNADSMVAYRDMITDESEKIDCGSYKIAKDKLSFNTDLLSMMTTGGVSFVHSANAKNGCGSEIWDDKIEAPVNALNTCYNVANNANMLYDKTWLIVSWDHAPVWRPTNEKLNGNFIFVINSTSAPTATLELPETTGDAKVFVYLPNGWKNTSSENSLKTKDNSNARSNYFIYSVDDIGGFMMQNSPLNGSVYMQGCSRLNSLGDNNTLAVKFNEPLFKGLVKSSILCDYNVSGSCQPFTGAVSRFDGIDPYQTEDSYHIATSPQLIVEMESQYRNKEPLPKTTLDYDTVASSEVVLPRIIYLPRDARGRFSDYYNVVGLNGNLKAVKDPSKMQCSGAIPTGEQMLTSSGDLAEGKYLCTYGNNEKPIPVFVVVEGSLSENSIVQFHDDDIDKRIGPGGHWTVRLVATESDVPKTVTISADLPVDGWHVEAAQANMVYNSESKVYTLTTTSSGTISVFNVKSDLQSDAAGVYFHITGCEKCIVGDENKRTAHVYTKNIASVIRENVNCNEIDGDDFKQKYGIRCSELASEPSCGSLVDEDATTWVTARGLGCVPIIRNKKWECRTGGNEVHLESVLPADDLCMAYVPTKSVQLKSPNVEYRLPAELKRKRSTIYLKREGVRKGTVNVRHRKLKENFDDPSTPSCSEDLCIYNFHAGDTVYFSKGSGDFSYWKCDGKSCGGKNPDEKINEMPFRMLLLGGVDTVTAWFGQKDAHCFYTNFQDVKSSISNSDDGWCIASDIEDNNECIDRCKNGTHCSVGQNPYEGQFDGSDWLIVYSNDDNDAFKFPQINNREGKIKHPEGFERRIFLKTETGKPTVMLNRVDAGPNGLMTAMLNIPSSIAQIITEWENFLKHLKDKRQSMKDSWWRDWVPEFITNGIDDAIGWIEKGLKIGEALLINDGLIFRSNANATEYFTLNVVAKEPTAYARLCYVTGQENNIDHCHDVRFNQGPNDSWIATASRLSRLNLNVDVNGNIIKAVLSKNYLWDSDESTMAVATFDLNDESIKKKFNNKTLDDKAHNYVGLKFEIPYAFKLHPDVEKIVNGINELSKFFGSSIRLPTGHVFTAFEVFDVGWRSYDYDADCWDTPKVSCSFKTNYAGGMVPYNTDVTPWVGMSSWFEDKTCEVYYYYNGCDVSSNKFEYGKSIPRGQTYHQILQSVGYWDLFHNLGDEVACAPDGKSGKGLYNFSSRKLRDYGNLGALNSDKYLFETEGYHGYPIQTSKASGYVNDASIVVVCKRNEDNNNSHVYDASCGDFIVGEYKQCSESYPEMLSQKSNGYCYAGNERVVTLDGVYNVRDAVVSFTLTEPTTSEIKAYLVDEDENISALGVDQVGDAKYSIDVAAVSDKPGFNPQKLHAILFKDVSSAFAVDHVESSCRYEFNITCNEASYSFGSGSWTVSAEVVNPERAEGGCEMILIADGYEVSGTRVSKPCSESFVQDFEHEIYGQSVTHTYAFKVLARDEKGEVLGECTTDEKEVKPVEIQCYVNQSSGLQYSPQGTGVPQFSFVVNNCPDEGCPYTLRYPSKFGYSDKSGDAISGLPNEFPVSGINTPENMLPKDAVYEYQLDVMGSRCSSGNVFKVVGEPEKGTCSNEKIVSKDDGEYFEADVTFENGGYWNGTILDSITVVYTDVLGNVIDVKKEDRQEGSETFEFKEEFKVSHKLPDGMSTCSQGVCNYVVNFKIYGDNNCSVKWTTRSIKSMNTSGCLATAITGQDPLNPISFTPVIGGCEDGNCNWTISTSGGKELDRGSGYNGHSTLSFSDPGAAGTRSYLFRVSAADEYTSSKDSCGFSVTYKPEATEISYCGFTNTTTEWGGEATLSFTTNCADCQYTIKSASGNLVSSRKTDPTGNSSIDVSFNIYKDEPYEVAINGKTCEAKPFFSYDNIVECSFVDDQGSTIDEIASNKTAQFKVRFNKCHNGSCQWNANLKHNAGNTIGNAGSLSGWPHNITSSNDLFVDIPGSGTYTLEFNDHEVCSGTLNEKAYLGDVGSCSFNKTEYAYGETGIKFKVNGLTAENERWIITNSAGTIITEGNSGMYNNSNLTIDMPTSFIANNENKGTYEFRLTEGDVSCPVNPELKVKTPRVSCARQCNKALIGSKCSLIPNYRLKIDVTNCANCSYVVKEGGNFVTSGNISTSTTISKNISNKNYTVYLNGTSSGIQCDNVVVK